MTLLLFGAKSGSKPGPWLLLPTNLRVLFPSLPTTEPVLSTIRFLFASYRFRASYRQRPQLLFLILILFPKVIVSLPAPSSTLLPTLPLSVLDSPVDLSVARFVFVDSP